MHKEPQDKSKSYVYNDKETNCIVFLQIKVTTN